MGYKLSDSSSQRMQPDLVAFGIDDVREATEVVRQFRLAKRNLAAGTFDPGKDTLHALTRKEVHQIAVLRRPKAFALRNAPADTRCLVREHGHLLRAHLFALHFDSQYRLVEAHRAAEVGRWNLEPADRILLFHHVLLADVQRCTPRILLPPY